MQIRRNHHYRTVGILTPQREGAVEPSAAAFLDLKNATTHLHSRGYICRAGLCDVYPRIGLFCTRKNWEMRFSLPKGGMESAFFVWSCTSYTTAAG